MFDQIKRAGRDHQVDGASKRVEFRDQSSLVIFKAFVQSVDDEKNLGESLDFQSQCIYKVGESRTPFFVPKVFAEGFDAFRSDGLILYDLPQDTADKFLETLGGLLLIVAENAC
jgi:hypothetical protein